MRIRSFLTRVAAIGLMLAAAACGGARTPSGPLPGAPGAREAVDQFMGAVRAQDLQALSTIWGTAKGPARDQMDRTELERRELLMMCYLTHERFIVQDEQAGAADTRVFRIALTRGNTTKPTTFTVVKGPSDRWYVSDADLTQLQAFCNRR